MRVIAGRGGMNHDDTTSTTDPDDLSFVVAIVSVVASL
jgi:hypothetical protein